MSPDGVLMLKLSKVAVWFVPPRNLIASPAEAIFPPPVARIEAPFPCSPIAAAAGLVVVTFSVPVAEIEPATPLADATLAKRPNAPEPAVATFAEPSLICAPAPSALTP